MDKSLKEFKVVLNDLENAAFELVCLTDTLSALQEACINGINELGKYTLYLPVKSLEDIRDKVNGVFDELRQLKKEYTK